MDRIKKEQDSLHKVIEEEIRRRDDTIKELKEQKPHPIQNGVAGTSQKSELEKCRKELRQKNKEIKTLNAKLDSYIKLLEERTITETRNVATKKVAISAEPLNLRPSIIVNSPLSKVSKTIRYV